MSGLPAQPGLSQACSVGGSHRCGLGTTLGLVWIVLCRIKGTLSPDYHAQLRGLPAAQAFSGVSLHVLAHRGSLNGLAICTSRAASSCHSGDIP